MDQVPQHGTFIPTVAHAAGGDNIHPWIIEDEALVPILTEAWKVVYAGRPLLMSYTIQLQEVPSIMW
jgi:hypothetical protein